MKIAIASDHAGYELKEAIKKAFNSREWVDLGTHSQDSCNYADYGFAVGEAISDGSVGRGIVICGTGVGVSIAANRYAKVRAALCTSATMARLAREHGDCNVLALGARIIGTAVAMDCVKLFLETEFMGGRHAARIETLDKGL